MKKILVITYYWPPSGGAGVQRWLKFVKYLPEFGWQPIVYTPSNGEVPSIDKSLLKDIPESVQIIKQPIWEPYSMYKKFIGQKKEEKIQTGFLSESEKPKLAEQLSVWIRGNFFIPDARVFWIKPSIKFLSNWLKENNVDAIATNGPPHSMHLIGLDLKKKTGLPWLADFRDPWTNIDFYDKLMLTSFADNKHKRLEKEVIKAADKVVTVSKSWAADFAKMGANNIEIITNGFDDADFKGHKSRLDEKFSIVHIGSLNEDRNPHNLWLALKEISVENPDFYSNLEIKMIGKTDVKVWKSIEENGLMNQVVKVDYLPHEKVVNAICSSQVLLLPINDTPNVMGVIPGKLFEYIAAERPILCIGPPEGDSGKIITQTKAGTVAGFADKSKIKKAVQQYYVDYKKGTLQVSSSDTSKFTRENLTKKMAELLNQIA